jgi:hypothetical protein
MNQIPDVHANLDNLIDILNITSHLGKIRLQPLRDELLSMIHRTPPTGPNIESGAYGDILDALIITNAALDLARLAAYSLPAVIPAHNPNAGG